MAASDREARRRRILERGSDRLALITGQVQTLSPPPAEPQGSFHSHTASRPPSITPDPDSSPKPADTHDAEDKSSGSPSLQTDSAHKFPASIDGESTIKPFLPKSETNTEEARRPQETNNDVQHPASAVPPVERSQLFTPNQIRWAISASESSHIYCSIVVALLIVFSHVGLVPMNSILFLRPLYLVLLTNISIVIARLLLNKQTRSQRILPSAPGGSGLAMQLGNALEKGLVLQTVIGAVFMDCSVYAVVLISGLALAQKLAL